MINTGSYAKVFRGQYKGQEAAVKIVHNLSGSLRIESQPSEAVLMSEVSDPNLLELYEWKVTQSPKRGRRLWLVLELCKGGCLTVSPASSWTHPSMQSSCL